MKDDSKCGGRGLVPGWPTRVLLVVLVAVLAYRYTAAQPKRAPTAFKHCDAISPILVGTHHKTGTVLLQVGQQMNTTDMP